MKKIWNNFRLFLIRLLSIKEDKPVISETPEIAGINNKPGIDCPQCGTRILTSIDMILSREPIACVKCGLRLNVEQEESKPALESLKKLDEAIKIAELNGK